MPKPRIDGDDYYPPIKKPTPKPTAPKPTAPTATAQPTSWQQQSYWERKAEQTRLEQEKYLQQMETELRKQWLAANKPSPVSSFFSGFGQAAQQFFQNTFMAPFTGQYYTPPATNQYAYNSAFQSQLSQSALARSLAAAKPTSGVLSELVLRGYNIPNYPYKVTNGGINFPNWSAPQKQVPQTFPLGSWAQNPDQYFGSGVNMGPQKPANMEYEAYVPIGYGGYSYGGGWGGGGGSSDYTSNPFYRGEATAQKPSYYAQYLTWRVK
jgi:hypothetical protein